MRRGAVMALLIIVCFILQSTVFQALSLAGISPNLLLIVTTSLGFLQGEKEGMAAGFFCGLLCDIFFGSLFGFYALLYTFLGYGSGLFHMMFYDEDIKMPMIWMALSELVYGLSVYFFMFLLRSRFDFGFYLTNIILPELVYTVVVTLVMYRLIRSLNRMLERWEEPPSEYSALSGRPGGMDKQTEDFE